MPDVINSCIHLFADDVKVFITVTSHLDQLQPDLHNFQKWATKVQNKVYGDPKCKVMHLGSKNPKYDYIMDGDTTIETVREEQDLESHSR